MWDTPADRIRSGHKHLYRGVRLRAECRAAHNPASCRAATDREVEELQVTRSIQVAKNARIQNVVRVVRFLYALRQRIGDDTRRDGGPQVGGQLLEYELARIGPLDPGRDLWR